MPFHPTKRCNPNSTQPQSAAKKMSPWCCSMVTYHGIESNSHVIFKETKRPIRIIKDNAWVEIERFSFFQTTPAIWIYRTIPNLLMWLFPVPIRCSLWVAICRWLLGKEVSVMSICFLHRIVLANYDHQHKQHLKPPRPEKNYSLKLLWVSSFFFFVAVFLLISANCLNQNFFHSRDKNGPPPVDQVVVEDRQRHPPWVFRYLKGPSRIDLGKIDATSTNSRGWFLKVMEKYVHVNVYLIYMVCCYLLLFVWWFSYFGTNFGRLRIKMSSFLKL